jgi:hypothetical protein
MKSWFTSKCKSCNYPVVVTQPSANSNMDYRWYCSNPDCDYHNVKIETGDMEWPSFVLE